MLALAAGVATTASAQHSVLIYATNQNPGVKAILVQNLKVRSGWSCTPVPSNGQTTSLAPVFVGSNFVAIGFGTTDCRSGTALRGLNQPKFTPGDVYQVFIDVYNNGIRVSQ
ncbi:hypothetical protein ADT25_00460 [Xanthomonas oryzae]|uniref:Uncharacterized protein n=1 Tax=Xanthomonas oryzae TaxID=347 RepID=A0AAP1F1S2_9XANT|nr:hypothetical protein ADT25_00460 [Xanthomonas oryzae]QBG86460.1 hypothetical protein EYR27_22005 [Xanthomonas oryzae]